MVVREHIAGYENFRKFVEGLKTTDATYYFFFSGSKLPSGESWCPDCVEGAIFKMRLWVLEGLFVVALPVVEKALQNADEKSHFVYVEVGDRPT